MNKPKQPSSDHPAAWDPDALLKHCEIRTGRTSGPGGQHRNRVDTAVVIVHTETGLEGRGHERRSQTQNRSVAIFRLRMRLARKFRRGIRPKTYRPSQLWVSRRQGKQMPVNPKNKDYPGLLAEALDVVNALNYDVAGAAGILGLSMSQLAKLIRHDKAAFAQLNEGREERGLQVLRK